MRGGCKMAAYKTKKEITHQEAKKLFDILVIELEKEENLDERTIRIVNDIILLEQIKYGLIEDIQTRGVVEWFKNGTQEMYRDNKSVDKIMKCVDQQIKLQRELKLTPSSDKKIAEVVSVDEFDKF